MKASLHIAQDPAADEVLSTDPFALLVGMLLDQQFPMERAFAGPAKILERFGTLDPARSPTADPEAFADPLRHPAGDPPLRPLDGRPGPGARPRRRRGLRRRRRAALDRGVLRRATCWRGSGRCPGSASRRPRSSPRWSASSSACGPDGWEAAAGAYAEAGSHRCVADVVDQDSLDQVRAFKQEQPRRPAAR